MEVGVTTYWKDWISAKDPIVALQYQVCDRTEILNQFCTWGELEDLPVYYWNPGYRSLQQVIYLDGKCTLQPTDVIVGSHNVLPTLSESNDVGIYLLEGVLDFDIAQGQLSSTRSHELTNAFYRGVERQYWVLLDSYIELPTELQPLIPLFSKPLPTRLEVQEIVFEICDSEIPNFDLEQRSALVRACLGLPSGEIKLVLNRLVALSPNLDNLVQSILQHKMGKLRGRGLDYISEPDVEGAAGLDLLNQEIDKLKALLDPAALQHGLQFPKGWCLWGPPGTGKSLSAKLTASSLGLPLIASDWGALLGSDQPDRALRDLLEIVESLAPVIFYFDDFDKGFAGWDSAANGGVIRRISGKFLTWLQEHNSTVFMLATVNRLNNLPPELIRRFSEIFFVDMPKNGGIYDIFNLHLRKYFPQFRSSTSPFTDDQWRILIRDYNLCTPAEIANAVKKAAQEVFVRNQRSGYPDIELKVTLKDLRDQRSLFTPAMVRDEDQIYAIRNKAPYARPASGNDKSRFAASGAELFS